MPKVTKYPRLRSHVRKNKSGKVRAYYYYDGRPDGKPDTPLGTDYAEAVEKWAELYEHKPRVKGRLQEAIDKWKLECLPVYTNESTKRDYLRQVDQLGKVLGNMAWDEITLPILREYLDRRVTRKKNGTGLAKTQGNREMSVLSIVWGKARLWGMTRLPWPAQGVKGWKHGEQAREFEVTDALFDSVYEVADQMLKDCMDIATATGMRLTDCRNVRLPVGDVLSLKASKTGKAANFDLSMSKVFPGLLARRRGLSASHVMLLSTADGFPVTASALRSAWDKARELAAAKNPALAGQINKMYLRDMRKRASDLADDMQGASELLQHSSTAVTAKHYRGKVSQLKTVR